ncbi:MAG: hypothetical protein MJ211_13505 [Bacteroidales bacterium]|nr:hypothetical protein [Bacteroidales bacterium]
MNSNFIKSKGILASMLQATKNIIAVTMPFNNASDLEKQVIVYDNVYMNLVIINEAYIKCEEQVRKEIDFINWNEIIRYADLMSNDNSANEKEVFYIAKSLIPRLKSSLDSILSDNFSVNDEKNE